jgi:AcrR family transcriptional regulator
MAIKFPLPCFALLSPDASVRDKILTAASDLLLNDGFSALTQQAVAARAGVRQSHVTYYFRTRNDLLRATAQFGIEAMLAPVTEAAAQGAVTRAEFRQLLMPEMRDRQWFRLMMSLLIASDEDPSIRPWLQSFHQHVEERLAAAFAAVGVAVTADQLHSLHATFFGLLFHDMHFQTDESFARVIRAASLALDGVLAASEQTAPTAPTMNVVSNLLQQ